MKSSFQPNPAESAALIRDAREAAKMSETEFASTYRFPLQMLTDLSEGRGVLDGPTRAYLILIRAHPQFVRDKLLRYDRPTPALRQTTGA